MKSTIGSLICLLLSFFLMSCQEETEVLDNQADYEYFPLEVGRSWVYEVDSLIFSPAVSGNKIDSIHSFIKDTIVEQFVAVNGDTIYRAERYERRTDTVPWRVAAVFSMHKNKQQAFRTEQNLQLIKLVFPLNQKETWNSTLYIDPMIKMTVTGNEIQPFNYWGSRATIEDKGVPLSMGQLQFPETATVTYVDRNDISIASRVAKEVYARGVGLVKKDWQILDNSDCYTSECVALPWRQRAERGFIVAQRLIESN